MLKENTVHLGDCLDLMPSIPSKSVDMILCDLPYGTTACEWDSIIDMGRLWQEYERVIKDNGAIVLTANSVFTFKLWASNPSLFRYKWIWIKSIAYGFLNSKKRPLTSHEDVLVFYKKQTTYNAQKRQGDFKPYVIKDDGRQREHLGAIKAMVRSGTDERLPLDYLCFDNSNFNSMHPTQKPVALFEYLIKTYTNEGELVLDNCSGSGTTAIACMNANRRFICIERDETYHRKSIERISNHEPLFHLGGK